MATFTAQQLITAGLLRADMQNGPLAFIQNTPGGESFNYLNAALSELYEILYEADNESYASAKASFSTVASQSDYPLTATINAQFYHLRGVDYFDGQNWRDLDRVNFADRNRYPISGIPRGYSLEGDNLTLYPAPAAVYSMRAAYVPLPPTMSADADTVDLKGPWREYIELHFAVQCLEKEESDTSVLGTRKAMLENRIRAAAKKRDNGKPVQVVDVQGDLSPTPYAWWLF